MKEKEKEKKKKKRRRKRKRKRREEETISSSRVPISPQSSLSFARTPSEHMLT